MGADRRQFAIGTSGGRTTLRALLQLSSFLLDHGMSLEEAFMSHPSRWMHWIREPNRPKRSTVTPQCGMLKSASLRRDRRYRLTAAPRACSSF